MEQFTKNFVKSDILKSKNLSFFQSHFRAFGSTIPKKIFFPKIFCFKNILPKKNIFSKNIFDKKYFQKKYIFLNRGTKCSEMALKKRQIFRL